MTFDGLPVERLREYLRELKPGAQSLLISELERGLLRGDEMSGTDMVLRELRRVMRDKGRPPPRIGSPARMFFRPFEPFLVDEVPDHQHRCRIARVALDPIWEWICRDVMPAEAKLFSDEMSRLLLIEETEQAEALATSFRENAVERMADLLGRTRLDPKAMGRLSVQLGSKRAATDVECAITILRYNNGFTTFAAHLPANIKNLAEASLKEVQTLLSSPILPRPELLPFGLLMVMNRLSAPWQLIRLATRAAASDKTSRIAATPYAIAVTIVLDEVERLVGELRSELKTGRRIAVVALLKSIHDAARGLRSEIDLSTDSQWSRQLSAIRTEVSHLVKAEVESLPGRVRRLLRPRPTDEIMTGSELELNEVAETEAQIVFVDACRNFAAELAVNEMTLRACTEVQQYLDNGRQALLDGLRNAGDRERSFRQSQLDAAVRFCGKVFGPDYAAVLVKAAEVAANPERKAMRA